jgi:Zn-dependent protease
VFFEPTQTQFDLRFRLFGIPIRIHPAFWILSAALGWRGGPDLGGQLFVPSLLLWVAACFVSILIHEMGHVFMGRYFGSDGHIVLYSFGGLAIGSNALSSGRQRALVAFAGPLAQFLLLGVVVGVAWQFIIPAGLRPLLQLDWDLPGRFLVLIRASTRDHPLLGDFVVDMIQINLFWPILNLLPIWPLDGGQINREVCLGLSPRRGLSLSLGISLLLAGVLAVNALLAIHDSEGKPVIPFGQGKPLIPVVGWLFAGGWFMVLLFVMLAMQSLRLLQSLDAERRWQDEHWDN